MPGDVDWRRTHSAESANPVLTLTDVPRERALEWYVIYQDAQGAAGCALHGLGAGR